MIIGIWPTTRFRIHNTVSSLKYSRNWNLQYIRGQSFMRKSSPLLSSKIFYSTRTYKFYRANKPLISLRMMSSEENEPKKGHSHHHSHSEEEHHGIFGHSHSHSHHQPNELLVSGSVRNNPAVRITWIGLLVNVAMAASKAVGGIYFHSQALLADAIHSLSDMVADFLTLATVNVAYRIGSPTKFPLGYGKLETVGSLLVSAALLFAGVSVGWSSLLQVFEYALPSYIYEYLAMIQLGHSHSHTSLPTDGDHSHSHSHASHHELVQGDDVKVDRQIPNINAAWLAGGSILVKELLYRKTMKVGLESNSKVLIANAWHHRVDSLTSAVALFTVTGGVLFNVAWLDSIGGLCVSILIIKAGWGTFKSSMLELVDRGEAADSEVYLKVKDIISDELEDDKCLQDFKLSDLSVMTSGANTNVIFTLSTSRKEKYYLEDLNKIESKLIYSLKDADKFIKKVLIHFKDGSTQTLEKSELKEDHTHSH
ncbi:uncharacterized protein PRCAT00003435001 [Priceomyces carsonii]|uniref:uncharacterized protein n=1 Tax=Priceomyces carsonii TaxID=28549 RepID=UPI002ED9E294|nr:unnamed protein product [Priceomyces carsonii]